jgi:hypothetical protein
VDATILAYVVAGLARGDGFGLPPDADCPRCRPFWGHVREVLRALETEVQDLHVRVVQLQRAGTTRLASDSTAR